MFESLIIVLIGALLLFLWLRRGGLRLRRPATDDVALPKLRPLTLKVGDVDRVAYMPKPGDVGNLPLLLCFHGGLGRMDRFVRSSDLAALAEARGFFPVFPAAPDGWVDGRPERGNSKQDIDFVLTLIERLSTSRLIDLARVYAVGVSNGGMFVQFLATELPGLLAGAASVQASLPEAVADRVAKGPPVPFVLMGDRTDTIMPWDGGEIASAPGLGVGGHVVPVEEARSIWVRRNKAEGAAPPKRFTGPRGYVAAVYDHPAGPNGAPMRFVEVQGAGHRWPRWVMRDGTVAFSAGDVVLDFFANLPLRSDAKSRRKKRDDDHWPVETRQGASS
jgi:polyhydroxybutyrate depolymerase